MNMAEDVNELGNNISSQADEIEVLCSIYGSEWRVEDDGGRSYSMEIREDKTCVVFYVNLPEQYPLNCPPVYSLLAPQLTKDEKQLLAEQLDSIYLENIGQTVLYQWIEKIREFLTWVNDSRSTMNNVHVNLDEEIANNALFDQVLEDSLVVEQEKTPEFMGEIYHGEIIIDRKSTFQGHAATITCVEQVKLVLKKLYENKKIASATHNMYAYRINQKESSLVVQDCEDDGENQAGGRLMHLLQILNVTNVVVFVTRWYGGIHLGGDRFRHINNAARQALELANIIPQAKKKK